MVAAGVDVKTAQRRLGHANVTLTLQVYARATAEADRRAAELRQDRQSSDIGAVGIGVACRDEATGKAWARSRRCTWRGQVQLVQRDLPQRVLDVGKIDRPRTRPLVAVRRTHCCQVICPAHREPTPNGPSLRVPDHTQARRPGRPCLSQRQILASWARRS